MEESEEVIHGTFSDVEESDSENNESDTEGPIDEDEEIIDAQLHATAPNRAPANQPLDWSKEFQPRQSSFEPPESPFNLQFDTNSRTPRLDILKNFITDEMVLQVCIETNRFSDVVKMKSPNTMRSWSGVNRHEMWRFISTNVAMGLVRKPSIKDYWTSNDILLSPFFTKQMSRNRFEQILRCLHFVDNDGVPEDNRDRFVKLGDFLPDLLTNCRACVNPNEYLCLDESLLGYKGRLSFRQYNPMKRSRFGIKFFVLVDCATHVVLDMIPYQGKSTNIPATSIKQYGFGGAAVLELLDPYLQKNHKVVIDNFFNGPILAKKLLESKTFVLGTAQKRRKMMPRSMTNKLDKGQVETYSDGDILVERWRDRREVVMLNSFIHHSMETSPSNNPRNTRQKPKSVLIYNKTMGAVDEMDKTIKQYSRMRKTYKWYKKVFFYLVDLAIYNSYRVFTSRYGKCTYKDFLLALIKEIEGAHPVERIAVGRPSKRPAEDQENYSPVLHLPVRVSKDNGSASRSACVNCREKTGQRHQTQFKCQTCNVRLCIQFGVSCFEEYHRRLVSKRRRQNESSSINIRNSGPSSDDFVEQGVPLSYAETGGHSDTMQPPEVSTPNVENVLSQVLFDIRD